MTTEPRTLHLDQTSATPSRLMQTGRFRNVPLVDDEGRLVGVVRQMDILKFLAESFPEELLNLPPRPHQRMEQPGRRVTTTERPLEHARRRSSTGSRSGSPAIPATACS